MRGAWALLWRTRGSLPCVVLLAWEGVVRFARIPDYLLPAPTRVARELWVRSAILLRHTGVTLSEVGVGLLVALAVGAVLGVVMAHSRALHRGLYPILAFLQAVPKVAVAPLFVIWLGYGLGSKVLMVFLIAFFPIVVNFTVGLARVEPDLLRLMQSYRAGRWQTFRRVRFPNALPFLLAGLRIAVALAVVGAVLAEFVGADRGLGYLILLSNAELRTPLLFACLACLGAIGVTLFALLHWIERAAMPWARGGEPAPGVISGF